MIYFKRAAVYLAMGQTKKAIPDLDKSLELKKDFHHVSFYKNALPMDMVEVYHHLSFD